jgi:hypothetical protein
MTVRTAGAWTTMGVARLEAKVQPSRRVCERESRWGGEDEDEGAGKSDGAERVRVRVCAGKGVCG